ncbi:MAG: glycosyltransferase family 4 protein [Alphaproteobacteria bacterium]
MKPAASAVRPTAIVMKGWPRLSETFIAQEILELERRGLPLLLVSLRQPTDGATHPVHDAVTAPVLYLPEYLRQAPGRVVLAFLAALRRRTFARTFVRFLADLARDPTANRLRRFGQALVLARDLPGALPGVAHLYAHFLHTPASVTRYAAMLMDLPWSVSAHAKDIWTTPDWEKAAKLREAAWTVTCTGNGRDHLAALARTDTGSGAAADMPARPVHLVYHGLDLDRFPPPPSHRPPRDGSDSDDPVRLLTVGRLVEKKGYADLLTALSILPPDLHWHLTCIGGGELHDALAAGARGLGLAGRIDWQGARAADDVIAAYRQADLFVLPSRIADDGDRDGLPNVLMEALSQHLPVIAGNVSAVPELITDDQTGRLVPPDNPAALAAILADLMSDPDSRARLGFAGGKRVADHFAFHDHIGRLAALFGLPDRPAAAPFATTEIAAAALARRAGS